MHFYIVLTYELSNIENVHLSAFIYMLQYVFGGPHKEYWQVGYH
jgi:hypothetical protein